MKLTKKVLASSVAASVLAMSGIQTANAEIELGEGLSITGFVDMSFYYEDVDGADETTQNFAVDQVEVDFLYSGSDGVSAQVDIEYGESGNDGGDVTFVEQAFVTKQVNDSFSVKAGRFLSYSGWETEEPTGLYQYSATGYGGLFYGGYQQGVSAYYSGGTVDFMASVVNSAFDPVDSDSEKVAAELGVAVMPAEGFTAKLFYITDDETDLVNFWTSYEMSSWTFAFEYNMGDYGDVINLGDDEDPLLVADPEADGFLLMANYASGSFGITLRYHMYTVEGTVAGISAEAESSAITLAPSFIVSDNLAIVTEVRMDTDEYSAGGISTDGDTTSVAIEALYTF